MKDTTFANCRAGIFSGPMRLAKRRPQPSRSVFCPGRRRRIIWSTARAGLNERQPTTAGREMQGSGPRPTDCRTAPKACDIGVANKYGRSRGVSMMGNHRRKLLARAGRSALAAKLGACFRARHHVALAARAFLSGTICATSNGLDLHREPKKSRSVQDREGYPSRVTSGTRPIPRDRPVRPLSTSPNCTW